MKMFAENLENKIGDSIIWDIKSTTESSPLLCESVWHDYSRISDQIVGGKCGK